MICPNCSYDNLPGSEVCARCYQDLTQLDLPTAHDRVQKSLMEDSVRVLNPRPPVMVRPESPIEEATRLMARDNIGALLVQTAEGKLVGILTERDLLTKLAGIQGAGQTVGDIMTPRPETVVATDTLAFALHKMDSGGYRHLPVVEGDRPIGVISVRDMLGHFTRLCKT